MENGSVIKKLEIRKTDECSTCYTAIEELVPLAKQYNIPVEIKEAKEYDTFVPVVCMVEDEIKTCFQGYDGRVKDLFKRFVK